MTALFSRPKTVTAAPPKAEKTDAQIALEQLKLRQKFAAQAGRKSQRKSIVNQLGVPSGGVSGALS